MLNSFVSCRSFCVGLPSLPSVCCYSTNACLGYATIIIIDAVPNKSSNNKQFPFIAIMQHIFVRFHVVALVLLYLACCLSFVLAMAFARSCTYWIRGSNSTISPSSLYIYSTAVAITNQCAKTNEVLYIFRRSTIDCLLIYIHRWYKNNKIIRCLHSMFEFVCLLELSVGQYFGFDSPNPFTICTKLLCNTIFICASQMYRLDVALLSHK